MDWTLMCRIHMFTMSDAYNTRQARCNNSVGLKSTPDQRERGLLTFILQSCVPRVPVAITLNSLIYSTRPIFNLKTADVPFYKPPGHD